MKAAVFVLLTMSAVGFGFWLRMAATGPMTAADERNGTMSETATESSPEAGDGKASGQRPDSEWQRILTPEQYSILRQKGTEPPFSGKFWRFNANGEYHCAGCNALLFDSTGKYDTDCGWPSFFTPAAAENIETKTDRSHGMIRVEILCRACGGHLGHVFNDGPRPTGTRYCVNSAALDFKPAAAPAPRGAADPGP